MNEPSGHLGKMWQLSYSDRIARSLTRNDVMFWVSTQRYDLSLRNNTRLSGYGSKGSSNAKKT